MKSLAIALALTIAVIAVGLAFVANKDNTVSSATPAATSSGEMSLGSVESMVGGLESRLQQNPDDGKGWLLLAKSYRHMGRMDDARDAYKKAEALGSSDATVAAQLYGLTNRESSQ